MHLQITNKLLVNRGLKVPQKKDVPSSKSKKDNSSEAGESSSSKPRTPSMSGPIASCQLANQRPQISTPTTSKPDLLSSSAESSKWGTLKRKVSNASSSIRRSVQQPRKSEKSTSSVDGLDKDTKEAQTEAKRNISAAPVPHKPDRDHYSTNDTKKRDGQRCIITGRGGPLHGAHIGSHASTKHEGAIEHLQSHWEVTEIALQDSPEAVHDLAKMFVEGKPGDADKSFNMVTLDPYMHALWDSTFCGLKPLGLSAPQRVHLQFVWFYKTKTNTELRDEFTVEDLKAIFETADVQTKFENVSNVHVGNGRLLQTGDEVHVRCGSREEATRMLMAFQLRWAASQFQFLAGAAGVNFEDSDEPDWTDPKLWSRYWEETEFPF